MSYIISRTAHRRFRLVAIAAAASLALAACGDGAANEGSDDDPTAAAADDGAAAETADGGSEEGGEPDAEAVAPAPVEELAAEGGWNGDLHDLDFPGPGQGILQVAGETIEMEVSCEAPGVLDDHAWLLFDFVAVGSGEDAEGRSVTVNARRQLVDVEEASKTVYDYQGQERGSIQTVVAIGDGMFHSSIIVSPADNDSAGAALPVVRVEEAGRFTVDEDVPAAPMHDQGLSGPTQFSGECQEGWPGAA